MNFFPFDLKKILVIAGIASLPLLSLTLQRDPREPFWLTETVAASMSSVQNAITGFSRGIRSTAALYINLIGIKKTNRQLLDENERMKAQLVVMNEITHENQRLRKMIEFRDRTPMKLLTAEVIGSDLFEDHFTLLINRGTDHGVQSGMAIITTDAAVGYVFRTSARYARVLLLTDRYAVIDAIVDRTRARGIVEGESKTACRLLYLEQNDDAGKGDLIITSGLDNIFPKGLPVGIVTEVTKTSYGVNPDVTLQPIINPSRLEEVFVVLDAHKFDLTNNPSELPEERK